MSLKQYELLGKLGQGSFGVVYKARRKSSKQMCVVKQIQLRNMNKKQRSQASNQVQIMSHIKSPYIINYQESFIDQDVLNIVMQFCQGGDLSFYLKKQMGRPLKEQKIWIFFVQLCHALNALHKLKILHRDIKTMNVFLTKDQQVRLGDLGVAKMLHQNNFASTMVGTPFYLSPELCQEKPYNQKTDIWALGCVLYQMCTQRHPFNANNQAALMLRIIRGQFQPIPQNYSKELTEVVNMCLQKDYKRRPSASYLLQKPSVKKWADQIFGVSKIQGSSALQVKQVVKQKQAQKRPTAIAKKQDCDKKQIGKQVMEVKQAKQKAQKISEQRIQRQRKQRQRIQRQRMKRQQFLKQKQERQRRQREAEQKRKQLQAKLKQDQKRKQKIKSQQKKADLMKPVKQQIKQVKVQIQSQKAIKNKSTHQVGKTQQCPKLKATRHQDHKFDMLHKHNSMGIALQEQEIQQSIPVDYIPDHSSSDQQKDNLRLIAKLAQQQMTEQDIFNQFGNAEDNFSIKIKQPKKLIQIDITERIQENQTVLQKDQITPDQDPKQTLTEEQQTQQQEELIQEEESHQIFDNSSWLVNDSQVVDTAIQIQHRVHQQKQRKSQLLALLEMRLAQCQTVLGNQLTKALLEQIRQQSKGQQQSSQLQILLRKYNKQAIFNLLKIVHLQMQIKKCEQNLMEFGQ